MPKYLIERDLPGAGKLGAEELANISAKSNQVLRDLGPAAQWIHSYVLANRIVCVYHADDPKLIEEHARCGGFPCTRISRVETIIDRTTGETNQKE